MRPGRQVIAAVALAMAVTGCADDGNEAPLGRPGAADLAETRAVNAKVVACLVADGWDADLADNGDILTEGDQARYDELDEALATCSEPFSDGATEIRDYTDDQWRDLYAQEQAAAECLNGHGQEIPAIPSFEVFVTRYRTGDAWMSYRFVSAVDPAAWDELELVCPQPGI